MAGEQPDIVKFGIDTKQYAFKPTDSLVDAVTSMIQDYNHNVPSGLNPVMPGHTVRIRVFYENLEDAPQGGYSLLDKFVFDGEKATTPVTKSTEVEMVGNFAKVPKNEDGTFICQDPIILQMASYGNARIIRRDTTRFAKGGTVDLTSLLDGEGEQPQP